MKESTREAREKGICTKCLKAPAKENRAYCEACLEADRNRQRKNRDKGGMSEAHRKAISEGRLKAFASKDELPKRHYTKRANVAPVQMQGMINELELFISSLSRMTAKEYLEARENLINNILIRGRK